MGNHFIRPAKPVRHNVWHSRAGTFDYQYLFWKIKDYRAAIALAGYWLFNNPGQLKLFEFNQERSEFDRKQEQYEKIKYFERHRNKIYHSKDLDKPVNERREITNNQYWDEKSAKYWSNFTGVDRDSVDKYYESKWKASDIVNGKYDDEVREMMKLKEEGKDRAVAEKLSKR